MIQPSLDFTEAAAARDAGMAQAIDHAQSIEPTWGEQALEWITRYAATHDNFISEELTDWAAAQGFTSPADPRAWGAPFQKAARLGIIRKVGYGISQRRHLSPCPRWQGMEP